VAAIVASLGLAIGLDGTNGSWHEVATARVHTLWPEWLPSVGGFGRTAASHPVVLPRRIPLDPPAPPEPAAAAAAQLPSVAGTPRGGSADAAAVSVAPQAAPAGTVQLADAAPALPDATAAAPAATEAAPVGLTEGGAAPTAGNAAPTAPAATTAPATPSGETTGIPAADGNTTTPGVESGSGLLPRQPADGVPAS
jgi:hypothetical protein